jgi:acyl-CoA synthetase (AMP-forming)/AMP-acid ligase II
MTCEIAAVSDMAMSSAPAPRPVMPDGSDPAFLQLTSGTTGEPRAAVVSHRSLIASLAATAERLAIRERDVLATWVPLHHDLGLVRYVFGAMYSGCASHLVRPSMTNLLPWLRMIGRVRATITGGPDSAYRLATRTVAARDVDLTSLQFESCFGLKHVMGPAYGLAEATLTVTSATPGEAVRVNDAGAVSCGRPLEGIDVQIVDPDDRPVPTGGAGEIRVRGPSVFDGYFQDEAATRQVLRDGWLYTGDVGVIDGQRHLFLTARSRAVIKRAGTTIAPREIEEAVERVTGVTRSAATGVRRESTAGTEEIVVVAETEPGDATGRSRLRSLAAEIAGEVTGRVGAAPGRILLVVPGTIPRTATDKVRYDELRRMIVENALAGQIVYEA